MAFIIIIENAVILISSLLLCLIFSIVAGKAVCIFIEHKCGFEFYSIDNSVYVNTFLTFIIAVIMCCVINIINGVKEAGDSLTGLESIRNQGYAVSQSIRIIIYVTRIKGLCSRTEQSRIYLQGYLAY